MSKHQKTLARMCKKPVPNDIKWDDFKAALESLGYKMLKGGGSRRKFFHQEKDRLISCHMPHPSPDVDKGCIADVVEHLEINGFLEVTKK